MEKGSYRHSEKIKKEISRRHKEWWEENRNTQKVKDRNKKLSLALKGRKMSEEQKEKRSKTLKGRIFTEEHKKNLSIAGKGRIITWGQKIAKSRENNNNNRHSNKTREKMKQSRLLFIKNNPEFFNEHRERMKGKGNPAWLGGISYEPYDKTFNEDFKEQIRNRDNKECLICGLQEKDSFRKLDIHHIDYNKKFSVIQNCGSLCASCHSKTTINRNHWILFFQSLLNEKYGYNYSDNKIVLEVC